MIDDPDLRTLLAQPPDHPLDTLRTAIWAGVAKRERQARFSRGLLMLQSAVLLTVLAGSLLAGSLLAGARWSRASSPARLDVFSPRMALSVSTRLAEPPP